jgi:hypothetical protein
MIDQAKLDELEKSENLTFVIEKVGAKSNNSWVFVGDICKGPLNLTKHDSGEIQISVGRFSDRIKTSTLMSAKQVDNNTIEIETMGGFYSLKWETI